MNDSARDMVFMNKQPPEPALIHIMVALSCEAKPLIKHFRLLRVMDESVFLIFRNGSITLTVTGIGNTAMAAGVAYTTVVSGRPDTASWLNVGVAGHPDFPLGQACLAHKITDRDRGRSWYPPIIMKPPCCTATVVSCSRPQSDYEQSALYDMEASGFYETACRFSSAERVQCFKVVSDNWAKPADVFQPEDVVEMIENRMDLIDTLLEQQKQLAIVAKAPHSVHVERFIRHWRFSAQQTLQLEALLHRWMLLDPEHCPDPKQLDRAQNGSQVLAYLREKVNSLPVLFSREAV